MRSLFLFFCLFSISSFGQNLTYEALQSGEAKKMTIYKSYQAKNGEIFKAGDKITIGGPSHLTGFLYIDQGDYLMGGVEKAGTASAGLQTEVKNIYIAGTKGSGLYAVIRTTGGLLGYMIQVENALKSGELVSSIMTSDQALAALKKAKELMELGLITPEEYEAKKAELAKLIKQ